MNEKNLPYNEIVAVSALQLLNVVDSAGRWFVDVPANGVAFILTFGDDIVFAAAFFDVCRRTLYLQPPNFYFYGERPAVGRRACKPGAPLGWPAILKVIIVKNVRTNRYACHTKFSI